MPVAQSPILVAFNLFLLVCIVLLMRRAQFYPFRVNPSFRKMSLFLSIIFVLFSFWGSDWFHYLELYPNLRNGYSGHLEDVYVLIAQNMSVGYISFRFVIWGSALLLCCQLVKRLSVSTDITLFFFLSIWLIWFSYARVSLAMVLVYLGISLFYKPYKGKLLSYLLGIMLISLSLFFHKTVLFAVAVAVVSALMGLLNKKLVAILVPLLLVVIQVFISSFLFEFMALDSYSDEFWDLSIKAGQQYLDDQSDVMGLGAKMQRVFEMLPYYLLAITSYFILIKYDVAKDVALFMRIIIIIVLVSSLLTLDYGLNTSVLYVRFMRFAFIPASIVLSYMWSNNIYIKMAKSVFYIAILGTFYAVIYSLYCCLAA